MANNQNNAAFVQMRAAANKALSDWCALLDIERESAEYKRFAKVQVSWVKHGLGSDEHKEYLEALAALEKLPAYKASVAAMKYATMLSKEARRLSNEY
jgi:hypothetical protein